jgi:hypothetical protein
MKIFADRNAYRDDNRGYLPDILRAQWNEFPVSERPARYGSRAIKFTTMELREEADVSILPYLWNYYVEKGKIAEARREVELIHQSHKPALIFSNGDFTANIPFENIILFEKSSYQSRRNRLGNCVYVYPPPMDDYLTLYAGEKMQWRKKSLKPVVGFCGQAGGTCLDYARRQVQNSLRGLSYRAGIRKWEPAPFEPTRFRNHLLNSLADDSRIEANFIIRKRYRAGYTSKKRDPFHSSRMEFVKNILDSDYTVCVRGGGNFSVRFYETLCLGRIPIFVNTDCILPYDHLLNYKKYCVWVEQDEIPFIAEKVLAFHQSISEDEFRDLQLACRQLWLEYLSMNGFYWHFDQHFPELMQVKHEIIQKTP